MTIPLLRASSTGRIVACPASLTLPHQFDSESSISKLGTVGHEAFREIVEGKTTDLPAMAKMRGVKYDDLSFLYYRTRNIWEEVGQFFPNPATEVEIQVPLTTPGGITFLLSGHLDILSIVAADSTARIADHKTGYDTDADHDPQIMTYALLVMLGYKFPKGAFPFEFDRFYSAIFWTRTQEVQARWYSREEILQWKDTLCRAIDLAYSEAPPIKVTQECRYCPVLDCPAKRAAASQLATTGGIPPLTVDNAVEWYNKAKAVMKSAEAIIEETKRLATLHPDGLPAEDGKVLVFCTEDREEIRLATEQQYNFLRLSFDKWEDFLPLIKFGKTKLLDAICARTEKGKGQAKADFIEALRIMGATDNHPVTSLRLKKKGNAED